MAFINLQISRAKKISKSVLVSSKEPTFINGRITKKKNPSTTVLKIRRDGKRILLLERFISNNQFKMRRPEPVP